MIAPQLAELLIADPPERWEALGFTVEDSHADVGGVRLTLGGPGRGITAWAIRNLSSTEDIDGLSTRPATTAPASPAHPSGATAIDHVVITTPDFDRTTQVLDQAGLALRRIRQAGGFRQGFRRLGPAILELVEATAMPSGPARFWGLVVTVDDLDALSTRLGEHLGPIKPAVQARRRIATLKPAAGLSPRVAFMTPEPA